VSFSTSSARCCRRPSPSTRDGFSGDSRSPASSSPPWAQVP
jgi:hypothetical protein